MHRLIHVTYTPRKQSTEKHTTTTTTTTESQTIHTYTETYSFTNNSEWIPDRTETANNNNKHNNTIR